jgi:hypothetical protein
MSHQSQFRRIFYGRCGHRLDDFVDLSLRILGENSGSKTGLTHKMIGSLCQERFLVFGDYGHFRVSMATGK